MLDGTTTALELEGGTVDIDGWYDNRAGRSIINHGVSVGHDQVRMQVMHDPGTPVGAAKSRAATAIELQEMMAIVDRAFTRGAVAAGTLIECTPAATSWEIIELFRVAAKHDAARAGTDSRSPITWPRYHNGSVSVLGVDVQN